MISNRCARKSLVTNCNSIISKNYLRFLVDSNGFTHKMSITSVSTPTAVGYRQKESVELFAYPNRGSDKTLAQISKSPHLAVYIGMIYSYTNEECLSCLLSC